MGWKSAYKANKKAFTKATGIKVSDGAVAGAITGGAAGAVAGNQATNQDIEKGIDKLMDVGSAFEDVMTGKDGTFDIHKTGLQTEGQELLLNQAMMQASAHDNGSEKMNDFLGDLEGDKDRRLAIAKARSRSVRDIYAGGADVVKANDISFEGRDGLTADQIKDPLARAIENTGNLVTGTDILKGDIRDANFKDAEMGTALTGNDINEYEIGGVELDRVDMNSLGGYNVNQLQSQGADPALQALRGQLSQGPQSTDDYFNATVRDPMMQQFQDEIMPGISRQYAGQLFGSERGKADENAKRNLMETLVREKTRIGFEEQARQQSQQLEAAKTFGSLAEQGLAREQQGRISGAQLNQDGILQGTQINQAQGQMDFQAMQANQQNNIQMQIANQQNNMQVQKGNLNNQSQISMFNAGNQMQADQYNQNMDFQRANANQQNQLAVSQMNNSNAMEMQQQNMQNSQYYDNMNFNRQQANQGANMQSDQYSESNWLQAQQSNQQAKLSAGQFNQNANNQYMNNYAGAMQNQYQMNQNGYQAGIENQMNGINSFGQLTNQALNTKATLANINTFENIVENREPIEGAISGMIKGGAKVVGEYVTKKATGQA